MSKYPQFTNEGPKSFLCVGNPGAGKSTLLNGLIGAAKFESGVSLGEGKTRIFQLEKSSGGMQFIDTPGLADIQLRDQAAQEIAKALQLAGENIVLLFIMTLEAGRVKSADISTMKLILEAANIKSNQFAIIINKVTKTIHKELTTNTEAFNRLYVTLNLPLPAKTSFIYFYPFDSTLDDEDNKVAGVLPEFREFLQICPLAKITNLNSQAFNMTNWGAVFKAAEDQVAQLNKEDPNQIAILRQAIDNQISSAQPQVKNKLITTTEPVGTDKKPHGNQKVEVKNQKQETKISPDKGENSRCCCNIF